MQVPYGSSFAAASLSRRKGPRRRHDGLWLQILFVGPAELHRPEILQEISALSKDIGVILRDYRQEKPEQTAAIATLCAQQRRLHISGQHGFRRHYPKWKRIPQRRSGLTSCSVHSAAEAVRARRAKVDICFVSPLFTTQSHPGRSGLGLYPARQLARLSKRPCLALGGINAETLKLVKPCGWFVGHGAISAFLGS